MESGKIDLVELELVESKDFQKNVVIPYFLDIYGDLAARSEEEDLGVDKLTLLVYTGLPGILGERLFQYFDQDNNGYLDKTEFVKGFFRLYSSNIDTSIKFAF